MKSSRPASLVWNGRKAGRQEGSKAGNMIEESGELRGAVAEGWE